LFIPAWRRILDVMQENNEAKTILVAGGTGKTGRRVAARLAAAGAPVRIGHRSGQPPFDWHDAATWAPHLRGARAAYLVYYPDLGVPGAAEVMREFAARAVASGVRRLVLLSGRGEEHVLPAEQAVRESGAEWTIVRGAWFCQNFDEGWLLEPVRGGEIALPTGEVAEPFVDADDVADVAVEALVGDRLVGRILELTGPRLLTFAQAAAEIARAAGHPVRYLPVTADEFAASLVAGGLPAEHAAFLTEMLTGVLDGHNAHLEDGVEVALGRPARDFADYARDAAATGVWG
jgi:uncharacterized protein YbjT (DUF2867 family)